MHNSRFWLPAPGSPSGRVPWAPATQMPAVRHPDHDRFSEPPQRRSPCSPKPPEPPPKVVSPEHTVEQAAPAVTKQTIVQPPVPDSAGGPVVPPQPSPPVELDPQRAPDSPVPSPLPSPPLDALEQPAPDQAALETIVASVAEAAAKADRASSRVARLEADLSRLTSRVDALRDLLTLSNNEAVRVAERLSDAERQTRDHELQIDSLASMRGI